MRRRRIGSGGIAKPPKKRIIYLVTIINVTLILNNSVKLEPFQFATRWVQDFIQDWLAVNPKPMFDDPTRFLKKLNNGRSIIKIQSRKDNTTLVKRREWKFILRELDLVETLYAVGMHYTNEENSVQILVGEPFDRKSRQPMIPSKTPVDSRTLKYKLRASPKRKKLPSAIQVAVWERYEGKCASCGSMEDLQFDHIIPLAKGGSNSIENLQILCQSCNLKKGQRIGGEE